MVDIWTKHEIIVSFRYVDGILIVHKLMLTDITEILSTKPEFTLEK
jgi:hypothetical protein